MSIIKKILSTFRTTLEYSLNSNRKNKTLWFNCVFRRHISVNPIKIAFTKMLTSALSAVVWVQQSHYCAFLPFTSRVMAIIQCNSAFLDDLLCGSKIQDQEEDPRRVLSFWLQGPVALSLRSAYHLKEHPTYSHLFSTNLQFSYSQSLTPDPQKRLCV